MASPSYPYAAQHRFNLGQRLLHLHPPVLVRTGASPAECVRALAEASKPRLERLHLRHLYTVGRRYYLDPNEGGFRLRSNTRLLWGHSRARSPFAATLYGSFSSSHGDTHVYLEAHAHWLYTVRGFLLPLWMSGIALAMPWPPVVRLVLPLVLLVLAWLANRLHAALESSEMVFFVQEVLRDFPPAADDALADAGADIVMDSDRTAFRDVWSRFRARPDDLSPPD